MCQRQIKSQKKNDNKRSISVRDTSTDNETLVWSFANLDKNGHFRFDCNRADMIHKDLLYYIMEYSARTWAAIKKDTHDNGKSKHHFLDYDSISKKAKERIKFMQIEDDNIFSLALNNKLRVIGQREGRIFRAIWFDPEHEFCPSKR